MTAFLIFLAVIGVLVLAVIVYAVGIYNGLVFLKNNVNKSWSNIDVLLKQRYDELPKLVKVCEGYMTHERRTLEKVVQARSRLNSAASEGEMLNAQNAITSALRSLFAVVENYPELKADAGFRQLQNRITEIENQIADRREFYNESVNLNNIRIEQFPDVLVARAFHFGPRELWKIDPAHRADVDVNFDFNK